MMIFSLFTITQLSEHFKVYLPWSIVKLLVTKATCKTCPILSINRNKLSSFISQFWQHCLTAVAMLIKSCKWNRIWFNSMLLYACKFWSMHKWSFDNNENVFVVASKSVFFSCEHAFTKCPKMHQRKSPNTGQEKLDWILMSLTDSKHRQESSEIHCVIVSNNPRGGTLWTSESINTIILEGVHYEHLEV